MVNQQNICYFYQFVKVNFNEPRKGERDYVFYLYNSNIAKKMDIDEDRFLSFKD